MTIEDRRTALHQALRALWLAVAELVLTANDDQPDESDLASAEHVAQLTVEIQARLAEAIAAQKESAAVELGQVERLVREASLIYWRDLRAHEAVSRLRGSTRRRGGPWPSWWSGVEQSLERCEEPLVAAGLAIGDAWHELVTGSSLTGTGTNTSRRSS
ncbi:hypothetical protein EV645_6178 [Kribbella rubisoli]|jgi:hypothetical protein|uniref:Uncharacterized protein n=1 Tax=Kribbella rubisoli TaxID=3075929 RepID=A0A4Q7WLY0_9ACTN|nr:hypothetical protein [Kribbella rubisoli]RZU11020.1 hypothetical protein EV645_6178 [Kribbella rubisoli]